jgi:hypothetical protein
VGTLQDMGFISSLSGPNVWIWPAAKNSGFTYYEYIFVYIDDLLVIFEKPDLIIKGMGKCYPYKGR